MTKYLSRKIKFLSLFLIVGVVFTHTYNYKDAFLTPTTTISEGFNLGAMFEYFISNGLTRFTVPMFFAFSGYLFFRTFRFSLKSYGYKLKSRFFSLFIPFVIWTAVAGLFLLAISYFEPFASLPIVNEKIGFAKENGIVGILSWFLNPPAFQLWYVQQLMIFTVISPLIYILIKYTKGIIIAPFIILWLIDLSFIINSEAILFFMLGAYIAIFDKESFVLQKESKIFTVVITLIWVTINIIKTYIAALSETTPLYLAKLFLTKSSVILGIVAMWLLFDHIVKRIENKKGLLLLSSHMFFIYTLHEPLLHICYQLGLTTSASTAAHIALYICMPISIIAFSVIISMFVRKVCLPLHRVLTGNRSY